MSLITTHAASEVHPDDHMFSFMRDHLRLSDEHALQHYLEHGRETTELLSALIAKFSNAPQLSLLEFASGYGCVTRFILKNCPDVTVTCSDIHPAAIDFLRTRFGVEAILSHPVPEKLGITKTFNVVFVVSLFSHLPARTWTRWLKAISQRVAEGGFLIFTTHGMVSAKNFGFPKLSRDGYWFHPVSEQNDLDTAEYGSTITTFDYVWAQIKTIKGVRLIHFEEAGLRKNQDVYVLRRDAS